MVTRILTVWAGIAWAKSATFMVLGAAVHADLYRWGTWFGLVALVPSLWIIASREAGRSRVRVERLASIMAEEAAAHQAASVHHLR